MAEILVTGSGGFLGTALCRVLQDRGADVKGLTRRDGEIDVPATLAELGPASVVFHLAAQTFVPDSWNRPWDFYRVNALGTINVLEYCRRHGTRLVHVSAYVYGAPMHLPIAEDHPVRPNNPYAFSKVLAEEAVAFYAAHHGITATVLRPFNIYGPGQRRDFLIPHLLAELRAGNTIRVRDLAPRRDYVFITDVVSALVAVADRRPRGHEVFNIGSGESISVAELIALLQRLAGTNLPVHADGAARPNELENVKADIAKARQHLGWTPQWSLQQGLEYLLHPTSVAASV